MERRPPGTAVAQQTTQKPTPKSITMLDAMTFQTYAEQCAPQVHHATMSYLVKQESSFNPFAVAIIGGKIERQPKNLSEAVATANWLIKQGIKFSAGISQIYVGNWKSLGLNTVSVFDICTNLNAGSKVLVDCHDRAVNGRGAKGQAAIELALSCYYSNNFLTGFKDGYVQKIVSHAYNAR